MTELREKVARAICYWSEPSTCHDQYCSTRCIAVQPDAWCWRATDAILNLIGGDGWRPNWRHVKRGSDYQVVGMGAVQSDIPLNDMDVVVIYRDQAGMFWARRREEFFDGRFEEIAASPPPPASS